MINDWISSLLITSHSHPHASTPTNTSLALLSHFSLPVLVLSLNPNPSAPTRSLILSLPSFVIRRGIALIHNTSRQNADPQHSPLERHQLESCPRFGWWSVGLNKDTGEIPKRGSTQHSPLERHQLESCPTRKLKLISDLVAYRKV